MYNILLEIIGKFFIIIKEKIDIMFITKIRRTLKV